MNINIDNNLYKMHIINKDNFNNYKQLLNNVNICDNVFVGQSYEKLSYSLIEDGYLGFFLSNVDNTFIYSSIVIDFSCSQIIDKINVDINVDIKNSTEVVLLCSNPLKRIKYLTYYFFYNIIHSFIPLYHPETKHIYLYVAKGYDNTKAISFYNKLGFKSLTYKKEIMKFTYK